MSEISMMNGELNEFKWSGVNGAAQQRNCATIAVVFFQCVLSTVDDESGSDECLISV